MFYVVCFILGLLSNPFVVHEKGWQVKALYLMVCATWTPIVGIITYKFLGVINLPFPYLLPFVSSRTVLERFSNDHGC